MLQQRSFPYSAKQGHEGIYKCFEVVNILAGLELFKLTAGHPHILFPAS